MTKEKEMTVVVPDGKTSPSAAAGATSPAAGGTPAAAANGGKAAATEPQKMVPFSHLFRFADSLDYVLMTFGGLAALANGSILPLFSLVFGRLIDAFGTKTSSELEDMIAEYSLYFVLIGVGAFVVSYMQVAFWMWAGERQSRRIREIYLRSILRQDIGWFDTSDTQELTTRIAGDTVKMQEAISEKVGNFLQFFGTTIAGFIMGFVQGWQITLVMMSAVPLIAIGGGFMAKMLATLSQKGQEAYAHAGGVAEEVLSSIRTVVSFVGEEKESKRYDIELVEAQKVGANKALVTGAGLGFTMFVMFASYALAFWFGSKLVTDEVENSTTHKPFTGGDVVTVFFAVLMGAFAMGQASPNLAFFSAGRGAAYHFFETVNRKPAIEPNPNGATLPTVRGHVSFQHVKFEYPARPGIIVAEDLSLEIEAGTQVALVGESGSGKSTIINLLQRFYDPVAGSVFLDGVDIKTMNLRWLRTQLGLVSQEPALFATSIIENIRYGKPDATEEEAEAAAKHANIHNFISQLPLKYNTEVGDRGVQLSGGQKQRIAIARAIIRDPRVLLLDEATSALDNESEKIVQAALDKMMAGRTTIVIAHRLSTIRRANKIVVMSKGKVTEMGTHTELIARDGHYAHLLTLQQSAGLGGGAGDDDEEEPTVSAEEEDAAAIAIARSQSIGDPAATAGGGGAVRRLSRGGSHDYSATRARSSSSGEIAANVAASGAAAAAGKGKKKDDKKKEEKKKESGKEVEFEELDPNFKLPVGRIMGLASNKMGFFIVGMISSIANGVVMPLFAIIFSEIVTVFYIVDYDEQRKKASFWAGMFLVLGGGVMFANIFQQWGLGVVGEAITIRMRSLTFHAMLHQDIGFFDDEKHSTGMLTTRLSREATLVQGVTTGSASLMMQNVATMAAALVIAFINGWKLALVILCLLPLLAGSGFLQMKLMSGFASEGAHEQAGKLATNAIEHIRTVTAFVADERLLSLYDQRLAGPLRTGIRKSHISGAGLGMSMFILFASYGLAFWYGSRLVSQGEMTFAEVLKVFMAIMMSAMGLGQTSSFAPDMKKAKSACQSLFGIMDRAPPIDSRKEGNRLPEIVGNIEFRNIHFAYPSRPEVKVCNGISLQVAAGTQCALVGASGCGKSTLIALTQRFYDPAEGTVLIDGVDIKTLNLKWLRESIGLVSQEPVLFATTIISNIMYGKPNATREEAEAAARHANAHNFIMDQPQQYNTEVGDRGVQLSGGQKQRIAIARALVKNPRILLLDEATSALDSDSEQVVQAALNTLMVGRTTLVIAHRLSTIVGSTKIVVLNQGKVVEEGSHTELLALGGVYATLAGKAGVTGGGGGGGSGASPSMGGGGAAPAGYAVPAPSIPTIDTMQQQQQQQQEQQQYQYSQQEQGGWSQP